MSTAAGWTLILVGVAFAALLAVTDARRLREPEAHRRAMHALDVCHRNVVGPGGQPGTDADERRHPIRRSTPTS